MERECSGYRIVGNRIIQIISEYERAEIEDALEYKDPFMPVSIHIEDALRFLADKTAPNFRNSIKESISAVEAICKIISGREKAPLGQTIKILEEKMNLHPALKSAFEKLYGYSSDAHGIRHALIDEPQLDFEDAKFMLSTCSAFVNYLRAKAEKLGLISNKI